VGAEKMRHGVFKRIVLGAVAVAITIKLLASMPLGMAQPSPNASEFASFTQWCVNRDKISQAAQKTVAVLLETANTDEL
jgi:hypothetical protein